MMGSSLSAAALAAVVVANPQVAADKLRQLADGSAVRLTRAEVDHISSNRTANGLFEWVLPTYYGDDGLNLCFVSEDDEEVECACRQAKRDAEFDAAFLTEYPPQPKVAKKREQKVEPASDGCGDDDE